MFYYRCCHGDPCNAIVCGLGGEFNRVSYCMLLLLLCFITGVVMVTHAMLSYVELGGEFNRASYCIWLLLLCFITGVVMVTHAMLSYVDQEVSSTECRTVCCLYDYVHCRCCHGDPCNAIICGPGGEFNRVSYCMLPI